VEFTHCACYFLCLQISLEELFLFIFPDHNAALVGAHEGFDVICLLAYLLSDHRKKKSRD
jgi:hypothetical protein